MKTKTIAVVLSVLVFFELHQSVAQKNNKFLIPVSKAEKEHYLHLLSIIQRADLKGLDTLTISSEISDKPIGKDIIKQVAEKKDYLESEIYYFNHSVEKERIQSLIYTSNSTFVLDTITINRELIEEKDYHDLCQQISWKKQIIERENLESAYEPFNFFGTPQYLHINKTINENLPVYYFTQKEVIEKKLSEINEKLFLKMEMLKCVQQVLGEILYSATAAEIYAIVIPENVQDKNIRSELSRNISDAAKRLKILDIGEVEKVRNEIVYYLSEIADTNEIENLMNFKVKNRYLKEVIDETIQMRKNQIRLDTHEEWIGNQIDKIYVTLGSIREKGTSLEDTLIYIDPDIPNAGIIEQLSIEAEKTMKIKRSLLQCEAESEIYKELYYTENANVVKNLSIGSTISDSNCLMKIKKTIEDKIDLLNEQEEYKRIEEELQRIDRLIREANALQNLYDVQINPMIKDDSIKKLLSERIEKKIKLLQHLQYIEKKTASSATLLDFFTLLRKIFTFQALDEIKILISDNDPEGTKIIVQSLEAKRRYFESQLNRDKILVTLRKSLN